MPLPRIEEEARRALDAWRDSYRQYKMPFLLASYESGRVWELRTKRCDVASWHPLRLTNINLRRIIELGRRYP